MQLGADTVRAKVFSDGVDLGAVVGEALAKADAGGAPGVGRAFVEEGFEDAQADEHPAQGVGGEEGRALHHGADAHGGAHRVTILQGADQAQCGQDADGAASQ